MVPLLARYLPVDLTHDFPHKILILPLPRSFLAFEEEKTHTPNTNTAHQAERPTFFFPNEPLLSLVRFDNHALVLPSTRARDGSFRQGCLVLTTALVVVVV